MVKAIKKSSSDASSAAEMVVARRRRRRSSEKKTRRSAEEDTLLIPEPKKKKRVQNKEDIELVADHLPLHLHEYPVIEKILPEDSKTLFTTKIACPEGRKFEQADFENFFKKVGKVVNCCFEFYPDEQFVKLAQIEFESHEVAKKALKKYDRRELFGTVVELDVCPEGSGLWYENVDCTYKHHIICVSFGKATKSSMLEPKLRKLFSSCGSVGWIRATEDKKGFSIGHAYIKFEDGESFSNAFKLNGAEFKGAPLQVRRAKVLATRML